VNGIFCSTSLRTSDVFNSNEFRAAMETAVPTGTETGRVNPD
jgi:hypothetical protein